MATQWDHVAATFAERFAKAAALMDTAKEEVLAFSSFPRAHWRQIWSTNPLERLNKELKRRCRVVGIFPTETALVRLAGAVLLAGADFSTPTRSGWPPSAGTSRRPRWPSSTPSAKIQRRSPANSNELRPADRHRGSPPRIPTTRRDSAHTGILPDAWAPPAAYLECEN